MKDDLLLFISLTMIMMGMALTLIAVIATPIVISMYAAKVLFL